MATTTDHSRFSKDRPNIKAGKRRVYTTSLVILLLTAASINVLLTRKISDLRTTVRMLKQEIGAAEPLQKEKLFPSIRAQTLNGNPIVFNFLEYNQPTILYIFSPQCIWCTRNLNNVKTLAKGTGERYKLVGLSTSSVGLNDYVVQHDLGFPVYAVLSSDLVKLRTGTPRTLIISIDGKVTESWFGAYTGKLKKKIEEYFQIVLPGVTGDKSTAEDGTNKACE